MKLTQRDRILHELREAGSAGVRSDHFYKLMLPRFAARILELKEAGYDVRSEREGKFVRYRIVGQGAGTPQQGAPTSVLSGDSPEATDAAATSLASASSAHPVSGEARLFELPPQSAFTDQEWAA